GSAAMCALILLPFAVVDPGAMADDTVGFLGIQHLQRLPLPLDFDGPLRPSKLIEFYLPLVLLCGLALWLVAALRRRPSRTELALLPLTVVGAVYLLGRTDEFHLIPLSV